MIKFKCSNETEAAESLERIVTTDLTQLPDFELFWGGPFSQWAASDFVLDRTSYRTAEHYITQNRGSMLCTSTSSVSRLDLRNPST